MCDANADYLAGKHIPLFLVAVLVFLFFLTLSCFSLAIILAQQPLSMAMEFTQTGV